MMATKQSLVPDSSFTDSTDIESMAFDAGNRGYRALVFGASGISGWAVMRTALVYPSPNTFDKVIGLTSRPLDKSTSKLPDSPRLELHSGLDLTEADQVKAKLKEIHSIDKITHVYFAAYVGSPTDLQELKRVNIEILENAVAAVEELCPYLQFFTLQTGGKGYGVEYADKIKLNPPFSEKLPRIPQPYADNVFYYAQQDFVRKRSEGKQWKWAEIRPDVIVGFVPQNNVMNIAQCLGLFLSFYRSIEGSDSEVTFPGSDGAYTCLHTDTSQDILARFHIFSSLIPEKTHGRAFNVADRDVVTWKQKWPAIAAYFGLRGVGPGQAGGEATGVE